MTDHHAHNPLQSLAGILGFSMAGDNALSPAICEGLSRHCADLARSTGYQSLATFAQAFADLALDLRDSNNPSQTHIPLVDIEPDGPTEGIIRHGRDKDQQW